MNLYLASLPVIAPDALRPLLDPAKPAAVAVIANAWDVYPAERRKPIIAQHVQALQDFGLKPTLVDVRQITGPASQTLLEQQALVWVMGGNSFYLNYHLRASGFSELIKPLLEAGLVYAGDSAGSAVAAPTLHGIQHVDDPQAAPQIEWQGLGLTEFGIVPHWGNPKFATALTQCRDEMAMHQPVRVISDTEVLIVHGDKIEIKPVPTAPSPA